METESLAEKYPHVTTILKNLTQQKKHTAYAYSLFAYCSFNSNKNKHDWYRGEDHMKNCRPKKFCNINDHKERAKEIQNAIKLLYI